MMSAQEIAAAVRAGSLSARSTVDAALERIAQVNPRLNAFTAVYQDRARREAEAVDRQVTSGRNPGPLAGVPFAVKNLFDVAGQVTLAGSRINRDRPPAENDAEAVRRLCAAGAILVGALNMDEYAYGYTTENSHYGPTRNPHDWERTAGGSSGGSAAAVAAGLVPLALGTDTNGSVRVPAALCGIYGLKPTFGRVSRAGVFPFVPSLDHVGVFARDPADLALAYDALQGHDPADPASADREPQPVSAVRAGPLRIGIADGYFAEAADGDAIAAVRQAADALGGGEVIEVPDAARARAAAFVITTSEAGELHRPNLQSRPEDFDPLIRDRLLAGALTPTHWYLRAQRLRRLIGDRMLALFDAVDVVLAPATPCAAPPLGADEMTVAGERVQTRTGLGLFVQPLTLTGFPIAVVPAATPAGLPVGVQILAPPWREDLAMATAKRLSDAGFRSVSPPRPAVEPVHA